MAYSHPPMASSAGVSSARVCIFPGPTAVYPCCSFAITLHTIALISAFCRSGRKRDIPNGMIGIMGWDGTFIFTVLRHSFVVCSAERKYISLGLSTLIVFITDLLVMTAVTGCNIRTTEAYWELSGPFPANRIFSCRACKGTIIRGDSIYCRDGRKLRFMYHERCFTGDADPRTQENSSFAAKPIYHEDTAPKLSSLEGPRACTDADGRVLGRKVFKPQPPKSLGTGKWSVESRGYKPKPS